MENIIPMYTESNKKKRLLTEEPESDSKRLRISSQVDEEEAMPNLRISVPNVEPMSNLRISAFSDKPRLYPSERKPLEIISRKRLPPHRLDEYRNPVDELGNKLFYCDDNSPIIPRRVKDAVLRLGNDCAYIKNYKGTNVFTIGKTDNSEIVFQGGRKTRKHKKSYNKKTTRKQRRTSTKRNSNKKLNKKSNKRK